MKHPTYKQVFELLADFIKSKDFKYESLQPETVIIDEGLVAIKRFVNPNHHEEFCEMVAELRWNVDFFNQEYCFIETVVR